MPCPVVSTKVSPAPFHVTSLISIACSFELTTFWLRTSIKVMQSSLFPTAMVVPSGLHAMLMFSPAVPTIPVDLPPLRASHSRTLLSPDACTAMSRVPPPPRPRPAPHRRHRVGVGRRPAHLVHRLSVPVELVQLLQPRRWPHREHPRLLRRKPPPPTPCPPRGVTVWSPLPLPSMDPDEFHFTLCTWGVGCSEDSEEEAPELRTGGRRAGGGAAWPALAWRARCGRLVPICRGGRTLPRWLLRAARPFWSRTSLRKKPWACGRALGPQVCGRLAGGWAPLRRTTAFPRIRRQQ